MPITKQDRLADDKWAATLPRADFDKLLIITDKSRQAALIEGVKLGLEAAANGLEAYVKFYTEKKNDAIAAKNKKEARDFETMAMALAFRVAELQRLDPTTIAGGE